MDVSGIAPEQVTFEGRNWDVVVSLTAPVMALAMARWRLSPRAVLAWNIVSLLVFANTVVTVLSSASGLLHMDWPGVPFYGLAAWPALGIPAFLAPLALFLHVFSLRQNLEMMRQHHEA